MKTILFLSLFLVLNLAGKAQKYDVWLYNPTNRWTHGKLTSFDESKIYIKEIQKGSFLLPYQIIRNTSYDWDQIGTIKFRNETLHKAGIFVGMGVGFLTGLVIVKASKDRPGDFASGFAIPMATSFTGLLAGHLITSAKITIPLTGKSSKEKSEALRQKITKIKGN